MSTKPLAVFNPPQQSARDWTIGGSSQSSTAAAMLFIDFLTLALVFALAVLVRHILTPTYYLGSLLQFFPCIAALLLGFSFQGLYPGVMLHPADEMRRIFLAVTTVFLLMACASFLWRNPEAYSRSVFLTTWAIGTPCVLLVRRASRRFLSCCRWWGVPAIVLGSGPLAHRVLASLRDGRRGIRVVGILTDDQDALTSGSSHSVPILGPISMATNFAETKPDLVAIVTVPVNSESGNRHTIQDNCRGFAHVILVPDIPGLCSLGVSVKEIGGELGLEMPQRLFQQTSAFIKRSLDLVLSSAAILMLSPLFAALALAVRFSSSGPIFFGQQRCGRNGRSFTALKFRTMVANAEQSLADHLMAHPEQLMEWKRSQKLKSDPRVTSIGKWMRRFSLDELPQLFNVLSGEMSLIGPRPIVAAEVQRYGRAYSMYSRVRPGMTGLWQVSGRNRTTYPQRVALDEFYVNNWSVWLDLYILSRTLQVVVTADGAY